jgi:hypothetical protein
MFGKAKAERRGFALPMAVFALALLTASIVAAFSSTSAEIVANNAIRAQDRAFQMAEAGLQQFLLRRYEPNWCKNCVLDPAVADSEWTRVNLIGGYADVVATRVRPKLAENAPALFFIKSTGTDTMAKLSGRGYQVFASRTVGLYASFGTATIDPLGAWTSLNGITSTIAARPAVGGDRCGVQPAVGGVVVPSDGQWSRFLGNDPTGSPNIDQTLSLDSLKARVGIDWDAIVNAEAIPPDVTVPPASNWPASAQFTDTSFWPVIRVKGDYSLQSSGRGLIIADANFSFPPGFKWDGIVLVGGRVSAGQLLSASFDTIAGAVVSGLNRTLPGAVNPAAGTTSDNDGVVNLTTFAYNSCKAARAAQRLKMYFAWSNTWLDNVAIW